MNKLLKKLLVFQGIALLLAYMPWGGNAVANASERTQTVVGEKYVFSDSGYNITKSSKQCDIYNRTEFGQFSFSGDITKEDNKGSLPCFSVNDGAVHFKYVVADNLKNNEDYSWHIINDKSDKVDGSTLESDIGKGAIIVQTSLNGIDWITDKAYFNVMGEKSTFESDFFETKPIQLINGCYFRVIALYKVEIRTADTQIGPISKKNYLEENRAEVFTFYLRESNEKLAKYASPDATPMKILGKKIKTGKDNGYSGNEEITIDDPHYGWDIGTFFVNGYTRETVDSENDSIPVFLKNVGDKVTLWFNLKQNISRLNGNSEYSIATDKNGSDRYFEVDKTNFGKGTLIIRYTDFQGVATQPIIYTNYLAANARTGADTKVELFEEGDYEVALNYEILDDKLIDSHTNYRIFFKFEIRNGNCMVFPMDASSGAELKDGAMTVNGFKLDMARSRYLTIDVKRSSITEKNGIYVEDVRFNRPAKDGEAYTDEGVYTFTVKNLYTGAEPTQKVIYVGETPIFKALSQSGMNLEQINAKLLEGQLLTEDGTLVSPQRSSEDITDDKEPEEIKVTEEIKKTDKEETNEKKEKKEKQKANEKVKSEDKDDETGKKNHIWVFVVIGVVLAGAVIIVCRIVGSKNKQKVNVSNLEITNLNTTDVETKSEETVQKEVEEKKE